MCMYFCFVAMFLNPASDIHFVIDRVSFPPLPLVFIRRFVSTSFAGKETNFGILKFVLSYEAWENKTKETYYSLLSRLYSVQSP